ncbi:DUF2889 domain-containing protein [Leeia oryzae]|uniref:DUF2889 domain-containing protein n=1 Tax=Leeia oryzae TaxID=356662 RepID=UPI0003A8E185|nr:DUF2889 domain-containing protein [Leeia oryzae]
MSLPPPVERTLFHTRQVVCHGYSRADGLWDIEGRIVDTKSYELVFYDGRYRPPGEPLHDMTVRITINEDFLIVDAEAFTAYGPFIPCPEVAVMYKKLIGLTIGPGFTRKLKALFRGRDGCTHITELMGPIATTAYQTVSSGQRKRQRDQGLDVPSTSPINIAPLINTCHGWRSDGDAVKVQYPDFYRESEADEEAEETKD